MSSTSLWLARSETSLDSWFTLLVAEFLEFLDTTSLDMMSFLDNNTKTLLELVWNLDSGTMMCTGASLDVFCAVRETSSEWFCLGDEFTLVEPLSRKSFTNTLLYTNRCTFLETFDTARTHLLASNNILSTERHMLALANAKSSRVTTNTTTRTLDCLDRATMNNSTKFVSTLAMFDTNIFDFGHAFGRAGVTNLM